MLNTLQFAYLFIFLYLVSGYFLAARKKSRYLHASDTISELGEKGSNTERSVSLFLFLPVGLALLGLGWLRFPGPAATLSFCVGAGYAIAALFPCDPGSPMSGGFRQSVHNLGGAVEYLGGIMSLFVLAESGGTFFKVLGAVVALGLIGISFPNPWRGFIQKVAETALFLGLILAAQ